MWTRERLREQVRKVHTSDYAWENLEFPLSGLAKAAVLIPLVLENGVIKVWLTKRSDQVRHEKGEVSFPGGMKEPEDANEVETAVREAFEEIGLERNQVEVVGELVPRVNIRKILFTPVVGIVHEDFLPRPNSEVSLAFKLPLDRFLCDEDHWSTIIDLHSVKESTHFFRDVVSDVEVITWGITARYIIELACGVLERRPSYVLSLDGDVLPEKPFDFAERRLDALKNLWRAGKSKL